jgi:hypothetical protein
LCIIEILHREDVKNVADVSEAHPASIFRVKVHPNHFNPEDGGSRYLKNVDTTDHTHPKSRINIYKEAL